MQSQTRLVSIAALTLAFSGAGMVLISACSSSSSDGDASPDGSTGADDSGNQATNDAGGKKLDASEGDACATATYGQSCTQDSDCSCGGKCAAKSCVPPVACGDALLQWTGPTENTDGTCIDDLAGFTLRWWLDDGGTPDDNVLDAGLPCVPGDAQACGDGGSVVQVLCAYRLTGLANGTWDFAADSYNDAGIESTPSASVSKDIECP